MTEVKNRTLFTASTDTRTLPLGISSSAIIYLGDAPEPDDDYTDREYPYRRLRSPRIQYAQYQISHILLRKYLLQYYFFRFINNIIIFSSMFLYILFMLGIMLLFICEIPNAYNITTFTR